MINDEFQAPVRRHDFRRMAEADLPAVMSIEKQSYEFPWTEGIFRDCMRAGYACYVTEARGEVIGYGIISIAAGESHVLNLCVHPGFRYQGYGAAVLSFLMEQACVLGASCLLLEVRASNSNAIRLYRRLGFNEVGVRHAYYPAVGGREDALVFARELMLVTPAEEG